MLLRLWGAERTGIPAIVWCDQDPGYPRLTTWDILFYGSIEVIGTRFSIENALGVPSGPPPMTTIRVAEGSVRFIPSEQARASVGETVIRAGEQLQLQWVEGTSFTPTTGPYEPSAEDQQIFGELGRRVQTRAPTGPPTVTPTPPPPAQPAVSLPSSATFPATFPGRSTTVRLTLQNSGQAALDVNSWGIDGGIGPYIEGPPSNCVGAPIPPGGSCTVQLNFTPTRGGDFQGSFWVRSNAPGSPHSVPLSAMVYFQDPRDPR
jgi:hypothetical protein